MIINWTEKSLTRQKKKSLKAVLSKDCGKKQAGFQDAAEHFFSPKVINILKCYVSFWEYSRIVITQIMGTNINKCEIMQSYN